MDHAFAVGHTVTLEPSPLRQAPTGDYTVLRLLPDRQYRIKSLKENHERLAQESDLRFSKQIDVFAPSPRADGPIARLVEKA